MSADSASVSISVSPNTPNAKGGKQKASDDDANAFEISLEVAREEADGDQSTTNITIQGVATGPDTAGTNESGGDIKIEIEISGEGVAEALGVSGNDGDDTAADVTIEIETTVFSGDELAQNLSASTVLGSGSVALTDDGGFGVSGSISGDAEVRLEVGETLTFQLPETEGEVVGGQVTITNLLGSGDATEGALVFAYDGDDHLLASYVALGNETGTVTVDIDVAFARLDFKAIDNDSFFLEDNSNFGVSEVSAIFASVIEDLADGASQLIDDIITETGSSLSKLVDLGHFGAVNFEITRITADQVATIDAISRVSVDLDHETDRQNQNHLEHVTPRQEADSAYPRLWHIGDRLAG